MSTKLPRRKYLRQIVLEPDEIGQCGRCGRPVKFGSGWLTVPMIITRSLSRGSTSVESVLVHGGDCRDAR